MSKFYGPVGFVHHVEKRPGVWIEEATEGDYSGDVLRQSTRWQHTSKLTDDVEVSNSISIVADPYAYENFSTIKYVKWGGAVLAVTSIEVQYPRLILSIGGVYNGPQASTAQRVT